MINIPGLCSWVGLVLVAMAVFASASVNGMADAPWYGWLAYYGVMIAAIGGGISTFPFMVLRD